MSLSQVRKEGQQLDNVVVTYAMQGEVMALAYSVRDRDGAWQQGTHTIPLAWTLCHYGGSRPWFLCPQCARRVAVLALLGRWFACRHCARLPYASQRETPLDRGYRAVRRLRHKIGVSSSLMEDVGRKPKRMHWRAWKRFRKQEAQAQQLVLRRIRARLPWAKG